MRVKTGDSRNISPPSIVLLSKAAPKEPLHPGKAKRRYPMEKGWEPNSKEFDLYDNILVFCVFHWYYIILCLFSVINIILFLVFDIFQVIKPRRETRLYYFRPFE
ncbi:hypothetical protein B5G10_09630 [Barnesiella sp. An55]|nr:hypothetical protein B5G10_09630 [Barnesiella sp. An55]